MLAIVISSDSDSESDSGFEKDLAEAKRRSILESRLNIGERNDAGKVKLVLYVVALYKNR